MPLPPTVCRFNSRQKIVPSCVRGAALVCMHSDNKGRLAVSDPKISLCTSSKMSHQKQYSSFAYCYCYCNLYRCSHPYIWLSIYRYLNWLPKTRLENWNPSFLQISQVEPQVCLDEAQCHALTTPLGLHMPDILPNNVSLSHNICMVSSLFTPKWRAQARNVQHEEKNLSSPLQQVGPQLRKTSYNKGPPLARG